MTPLDNSLQTAAGAGVQREAGFEEALASQNLPFYVKQGNKMTAISHVMPREALVKTSANTHVFHVQSNAVPYRHRIYSNTSGVMPDLPKGEFRLLQHVTPRKKSLLDFKMNTPLNIELLNDSATRIDKSIIFDAQGNHSKQAGEMLQLKIKAVKKPSVAADTSVTTNR